MQTGIVMKITDKVIVLLCDDGKFRNIEHITPLPALGQRILVSPTRKRTNSQPGYKQWALWLAAASVLLCALGLSNLNQMWLRVAEPMAMVAVDINPSLMLGLDSQAKVVEVQRLNQDAQQLVPRVEVLIGKPAQAAVEIIVELAEEQGYLAKAQGKDLVMVTVIAEEGMVEVVNQRRLQATHQPYNIQVNHAKQREVAEAHRMGLSVNKYLVYHKAKEMGINLVAKELQQNSVQETLRQRNAGKVLDQLTSKRTRQAVKKQGQEQKQEQKQERQQGQLPKHEQSQKQPQQQQQQQGQKHKQEPEQEPEQESEQVPEQELKPQLMPQTDQEQQSTGKQKQGNAENKLEKNEKHPRKGRGTSVIYTGENSGGGKHNLRGESYAE